MERHFTAVYERDGDWWIAYVEELPGANSQGRTLEEARRNLLEAITLMLEEADADRTYHIQTNDIVKEELVVAP